MRWAARVAWLCCASIVWPVTGAASTDKTAYFDYLYIEANSGSSAGGHAAVRFGDVVYHFQHAEPGIVRPFAQSWPSFDFSYRGLGNRPIHVQRIPLPADRYERLRSEFQQRLLVADSHAQLLDGVRRDRQFLLCLQNGSNVRNARNCGVKLPGAGYFNEHVLTQPVGLKRSSQITALNGQIERTFGSAFLERRVRQLQTHIGELRPSFEQIESPRADVVASPYANLTDRYAELLLELLAIRVLTGEDVAAPRSFRKLGGPLTGKERAVLATRIEEQRKRIVRLLASPRSDRGYPLLVALARLAALDASLRDDELIVLDTYADGVAAVESGSLAQYATVLHEIAAERHREMQRARLAAFAAGAGDEASWSRFEAATNVALEIEEALAGKRHLRLQPPTLTPAKGTSLRPQWPAPRLPPEVIWAAQQHAALQEEAIVERLRELHPYNLVSRNCVTEILRALDEVSAAHDMDAGETIVTGLNFIPFVSAAAVRDVYRPVEELRLPSYREVGLTRMSHSWTTSLREATSLTSTLIPFDPDDEVFLFFTDDHVMLRPLLGLANVVVGVAAMAGGTLALPFDGGDLIAAGARGLFYSLPEVAFVNIRKGAVPLLASGWGEDELIPAPPFSSEGAGG